MSRKKKSGNQAMTNNKILLIAALLNLITALASLINKLLE